MKGAAQPYTSALGSAGGLAAGVLLQKAAARSTLRLPNPSALGSAGGLAAGVLLQKAAARSTLRLPTSLYLCAPVCLLLWTAAAFGAGAGDARLFFSRTFPGSAPPYLEVRVEKTGDAEYREAPDEELPLKFKLSEDETASVFSLAEKLDYFRHPLESPAKVAFMGTKLMRYESGDGKNEVKFNYSEDLVAQTLLDWFERMADSAELRIDLERVAKYDHLGVMHALETLQAATEDHRLVGAAQFLPMLDRIANNETYMHTARTLAADLAGAIRNPKK
jgi:hypothetical protein